MDIVAFVLDNPSHPELKPSIFWQIPVKRSGFLELCSFIVKLCSSLENEIICPRCHDITRNVLKHLFSTCVKPSTSQKLLTFWENVKSIFGDNVYLILSNLELEDFILGGRLPIVTDVLTEDVYYDPILLSSKLLRALFV